MVLETLAMQLNISPQLLAILVIWSIFWKGLALWKSARLNQLTWFIILIIVNTMGVLEIIYLMIYSKHSVNLNGKIIKKRKIEKNANKIQKASESKASRKSRS